MASTDLSLRRIGLVAGLLALTIGAVVAAVFTLLDFWNISPGGIPPAAGAASIPGPALQSAPQPELRSTRAEKLRQLHSAGWIDQQGGIAHIPIEQAITILSERGAPPAGAAAEGGEQ